MHAPNYATHWAAAAARTERFGLKVPSHKVEPERRYLTANRLAEFPYAVRRGLGDLDFPDVVAQCLSIHNRLVPVMTEWFGCPALFTLGWIDDGTERGMFKFDESYIADKLKNGHQTTTVNIHAWLTLPSMEIIDVALATTVAIVQNKPNGHGAVVAIHGDETKGFAYRPMLVGTDFLKRSGLMLEIEV